MDHNSCRNTGHNSGVRRFSPSNPRWIAAASATNDAVSRDKNKYEQSNGRKKYSDHACNNAGSTFLNFHKDEEV